MNSHVASVPSGWHPGPYVLVSDSRNDGGLRNTSYNEFYTISRVRGHGSVPADGYLCSMGATSVTRCGRFVRSGVDPNIQDYPTEGLGEIDMQTCQGDSGGPVYAAHSGYGIVVAYGDTDYTLSNLNFGWTTRDNLRCTNDLSYYQGLIEAQDEMNVDILLATGDALATVDPVDEVLAVLP